MIHLCQRFDQRVNSTILGHVDFKYDIIFSVILSKIIFIKPLEKILSQYKHVQISVFELVSQENGSQPVMLTHPGAQDIIPGDARSGCLNDRKPIYVFITLLWHFFFFCNGSRFVSVDKPLSMASQQVAFKVAKSKKPHTNAEKSYY